MNTESQTTPSASSTKTVDVVIVGASIAGTTVATLLARQGLSVLVVDRVDSPTAFKRQCTHFIQATATPVLEELGVVDAMERAGAVRNGLQLWTDAGWFRTTMEEERDEHGRRNHGYTLRREKLDPILRANAKNTAGVEMMLGVSVAALVEENGRVVGVDLDVPNGKLRVHAQLVVGADGRRSTVAELAHMEPEIRPHNRGGFMAYFKNVKMKTGSDAQFWILGEDVAYAFPSDDGLVCLAYLVNERRMPDFKADREGFLRAAYAKLADAPDLSQAEVVGGFVGAQNTPNTYRYPKKPGLVLVGDAAMASDYLWGVGCGWALEGGAMLAKHATAALKSGDVAALDAALAAYAAEHKAKLYSQHVDNTAFSASSELPALQRAIFAAAPHDAKLRKLIALGGTGRISRKDLRVPLRLLAFLVTKPFRRAVTAATAPIFVGGRATA